MNDSNLTCFLQCSRFRAISVLNDKIILKTCLDLVLNWHNDAYMSCDECVLQLNGLVNCFQKCITIGRLRKFV